MIFYLKNKAIRNLRQELQYFLKIMKFNLQIYLSWIKTKTFLKTKTPYPKKRSS